jgi:hypothetical protein
MPPGRPKIDPVRDRDTLLDHATRRAIARLCRQKPSSVGGLEKSVGKKSLKGQVETMESWGILKAVGMNSRGKPKYVLTPAWAPNLDEAVARNTSAVLDSQSFIVLAPPDLDAAAQCLAREHADHLSWVGVVGAREGLLIGVGSGGDASVAEIEESLRTSGIECKVNSIGVAASGSGVAPFLRGFGADSDTAGP